MDQDPPSSAAPPADITAQQLIAEQIYREMAPCAAMDGVTFDDEQRGFILQALSDAALAALRAASAAPPAGIQQAMAILCACDEVLAHLWDLAARFDPADCTRLRDPIHRFNTMTKKAILDLDEPAASAAPVSLPLKPVDAIECGWCEGKGWLARNDPAFTLGVEEGQMVDIYGVPIDVHSVRRFPNGWELGGGYDLRDPATWFVFDRESSAAKWHKHCGPYSTFEQAKDWILAIQQSR